MTHNCKEMGCSACEGQNPGQWTGSDAADAMCDSEFLVLAKKRFSVRKYKGRQVAGELINTVIEAGRVAPTGANLQPYKIILVNSEDGMAKLAKGAKTCGAPVAFVICSDTGKAFKRPFDGKSMSDIDVSIVTDHMMLAATDLGLGSLWMTYFDPKIIRSEFNIPDNFEPVNILLIGYSDEQDASPDRHTVTRRKTAEVVAVEMF